MGLCRSAIVAGIQTRPRVKRRNMTGAQGGAQGAGQSSTSGQAPARQDHAANQPTIGQGSATTQHQGHGWRRPMPIRFFLNGEQSWKTLRKRQSQRV